MFTFLSNPMTLVVAVCVVNMALVLGMIWLIFRCKELAVEKARLKDELKYVNSVNDHVNSVNDHLENEISALEKKNSNILFGDLIGKKLVLKIVVDDVK